MSCDVDHRPGSDPELLWLWRRPVAIASIGPLAWEPPYAAGAAHEIAKTHTHKKRKANRNKTLLTYQIGMSFFFFSFFPLTAAPVAYGRSWGQVSNLSLSCNLSHSCSNTRSLAHHAGPGIKPVTPEMSQLINPLHHSRNSWQVLKRQLIPMQTRVERDTCSNNPWDYGCPHLLGGNLAAAAF